MKFSGSIFVIPIVTILYIITILLTNSTNHTSGLFEYFSIIFFFLFYFLFKRMQYNQYSVICPINIALAVFFFRLVVTPYIAMLFGYFHGVLWKIEKDIYLEISYIITILSFLGFAIGYSLERGKTNIKYEINRFNLVSTGVVFIIIGVISNILLFKDFKSYLFSVFMMSNVILQNLKTSGFILFIGTIGRIFLPFGVILISYSLLRKRSSKLGIWVTIIISSLLIIFSNLGSNRQAIIYPLIAYFAGLSPSFIKIKLRATLVIILLSLVGLFSLDDVRSSGELIITQKKANKNFMEDYIEKTQVYIGGVQFLAPVIKNFETSPSYTNTLFSSLVESWPSFGRSYRYTSGSFIYNKMLTRSDARDQVLPTSAELYYNFYFFGVIIGFMTFGYIYAKLNRLFFIVEMANNPEAKSAVLYLALLFNASILLSFSVLGQFFMYSTLPAILIYFLTIKKVRK